MADRLGPEQTMRGRVVAVDEDESATVQPRPDTGSAALRQAVAVAVSHAMVGVGEAVASAVTGALKATRGSHPKLMHAARMIGATILLGGATTAGFVMADEPDCSPTTMQLVLHMADKSKPLYERLRAEGRAEEAELVKAMFDPNQLPDDLRLCLLLGKRGSAKDVP